MIDGRVIFQDWEIEQLNEFVKYTSEKNLKEEATREGLAEGMKKGMKKGIKQGMKRGIEQGKNQLLNDHVIAMLKENIDVEVISRVTGKTVEKIMIIKDNME